MTNLDPNKTYIYERVEGQVYAREVGTLNRTLVGHDVTSKEYLEEWKDVFLFARVNPMLQEELDRVKMLYYLLKEQKPKVFYHPV
jgi:hypothetical protein